MWKRFERIPLLPIGATGFLFGIFIGIACRGKETWLDAERLCVLKEQTVAQSALIFEVLKMRGGMILFMIMAGTTYLAPAACILCVLWIGMSFGVFWAVAVMQYGIKGILLLPAATLPHFLIYLPAYYFLARWCEKLHRAIYQRASWKKWNALVELIVILLAVAAGVFLECRFGTENWSAVLQSF